MVEKLLLATKNRGKVNEIIPLLERAVREIISLSDLDESPDVEECCSEISSAL